MLDGRGLENQVKKYTYVNILFWTKYYKDNKIDYSVRVTIVSYK